MLESWHIQHHQSPLNREGYFARTMLHCWPDHTSIWHPSISVLLLLLTFPFPPLISLVSYLLHCTRLCPPLFSCVFFPFLYPYTSRDHIIVWLPYCIYTCVSVSVNNLLMKAAIGCRNVWITVSLCWLAQWIDWYNCINYFLHKPLI